MGIMLVYDITNEKSFDNILKWLRNIDEHANEDVEKMILGKTKYDEWPFSDFSCATRKKGMFS